MKLSVKSDYAARAVLSLARAYATGSTCTVEDLAAERGLPAHYLAQILLELKAKHIVRSQRGKKGGYVLARPPAHVTFGEVLRAVHGRVFDSPALSDPHCPPELRNAWERLRQDLESSADSITFQEVLDQASDKAKMYYI